MIRVVVIGIQGKMGSVMADTIKREKDMELLGGVERDSPEYPKDIKAFPQADVFVDFTNPDATLQHIKFSQKPYLIGTTGFSLSQLKEIKEKSKEIPILLSPNFSIGVNLLFRLTEYASRVLKNYDARIIELHHSEKRDAPSGTAKRLREIIKEVKKRAPGVVSVRAGGITGEHTVLFATKGERIELTHRAESREAFAKGALLAIRFIHTRPPGLYSMRDVLQNYPV